jgi:hypothetical protein
MVLKIIPISYRYDYRAGFWGVMGQSCLGMIPVRKFILDLVRCCTLVIP